MLWLLLVERTVAVVGWKFTGTLIKQLTTLTLESHLSILCVVPSCAILIYQTFWLLYSDCVETVFYFHPFPPSRIPYFFGQYPYIHGLKCHVNEKLVFVSKFLQNDKCAEQTARLCSLTSDSVD